MKRMVCLALSVLLALLYPVTGLSAGSEEYITVPFLSLDMLNERELDLMIKNGDVYVDAEMLAGWLYFQFSGDDECIAIYDGETPELSVRSTRFYYDTAKVEHRLFSRMTDVYEAPFPSIRNDRGFWIPLEYSLLILNCLNWILEDAIIVDMPQKSMMDYFYERMIRENPYHFDWYKDYNVWLGDGGTGQNISEERIRMLNGLLRGEGDLWPSSFQAFTMGLWEYDEKYAENLSLFLCERVGSGWRDPAQKVEAYREILTEFEKEGGERSDWDLFFFSALFDFLDTSENHCALTGMMKQSMKGYLRALSGDVERAALIRDFNSALGKDETELPPIKQWEGIRDHAMPPSDMALRYHVPVPDKVKEGDRLNVLYLQAFQDDVLWNFQRLYQKMSCNPETLCPADMYRLSQYCYIYSMSSYAARSAALDIWKAELEPQMQLLLHPFLEEEVQKKIDSIKMGYLLASADKTNEWNVYGFLPSDNAEYLKNYDSSKLIAYIESVK